MPGWKTFRTWINWPAINRYIFHENSLIIHWQFPSCFALCYSMFGPAWQNSLPCESVFEQRQSLIEELHPKFFEPPGRVCLYLLMICWVGVEPELLFGVWCSPSVRKPCSRRSVYSLLAIHLRKTQKALGTGRCSSNNTVSKSWTDPKIAHSFVLKASLQLLPHLQTIPLWSILHLFSWPD